MVGIGAILYDDDNNGSMVLKEGWTWLEGSPSNEDYYGKCDSCSEKLDAYYTGYVVDGTAWSICMDCFDGMPGREGVMIEHQNGKKSVDFKNTYNAETHSYAPHEYYTPVGPSDSPDVSGYLSHDDHMDINSFMAEVDIRQGRDLNPNSEQMAWIEAQNRKIEQALKNPRKNARIIDKYMDELTDYIHSIIDEDIPKEFESQYAGGFGSEGDSGWTTQIGHEQRKARNPNYDPSTSFGGSQGYDYTCTCGMTCEICNKAKGLCGKDGIMYSPSENVVACSGCRSSSKSAESVGFAAEYDGPSTLSSALSGARKTDKNGRHLTVMQRLVAKYGIQKGTRIYKHFGVKQKRASPKVRGKTRGTKSGPRRYSEGRVGGAGRSQVYQKGDRTGSWTPSGGYTTSYANSGKAWYQERGYGTPVMGPVPDTPLAGKAMGEKARGRYVNPAGIVGYPFVPAQQREQKK
jgi:hypothetical protein